MTGPLGVHFPAKSNPSGITEAMHTEIGRRTLRSSTAASSVAARVLRDPPRNPFDTSNYLILRRGSLALRQPSEMMELRSPFRFSIPISVFLASPCSLFPEFSLQKMSKHLKCKFLKSPGGENWAENLESGWEAAEIDLLLHPQTDGCIRRPTQT